MSNPYREEAKKPSCTASDATGLLLQCKKEVTRKCVCRRCTNEPEHAFYTCQDHVLECGAKHLRIYDRTPDWALIPQPSIMDLVPDKVEPEIIDSSSDTPTQLELPLKDDWGGAKQW